MKQTARAKLGVIDDRKLFLKSSSPSACLDRVIEGPDLDVANVASEAARGPFLEFRIRTRSFGRRDYDSCELTPCNLCNSTSGMKLLNDGAESGLQPPEVADGNTDQSPYLRNNGCPPTVLTYHLTESARHHRS
jgi:hypothetical protein